MALAQRWLAKAKFARTCTELDEPWPAWSTGEVLAVAVILRDPGRLEALGYTEVEALERLRHDIAPAQSPTSRTPHHAAVEHQLRRRSASHHPRPAPFTGRPRRATRTPTGYTESNSAALRTHKSEKNRISL